MKYTSHAHKVQMVSIYDNMEHHGAGEKIKAYAKHKPYQVQLVSRKKNALRNIGQDAPSVEHMMSEPVHISVEKR